MSPIATETYGLPPVASSSHTCGWVSMSAWIHPSVCASFTLGFCMCVLMCVQPTQHSTRLSQIYNSGAQQGMNTLVSVEDVEDEQRTGLMWLLSILSGNYSTIYYQRKSEEGGKRRYHIWFGVVSQVFGEHEQGQRDRDRSLYPSFPWALCDLITAVPSDILPCMSSLFLCSFCCLNSRMTKWYANAARANSCLFS